MALPEEDDALEQVRPAQERAVVRIGAADHDMVAAAGAGVAAVDHELFRAEAGLAGLFIDLGRDVDAFAPAARRVDIDLDDAGIGGDADDVQPFIVRQRIALDMDRKADACGRALGRRDEVEIILDGLSRGA